MYKKKKKSKKTWVQYFRCSTLSSLIKFKHINALKLIVLEKDKMICVLLVNITMYEFNWGIYRTTPKELLLNFSQEKKEHGLELKYIKR